MEVTGKIKKIYEKKKYGSNGLRKLEVVMTTEEQYKKLILIEYVKDK